MLLSRLSRRITLVLSVGSFIASIIALISKKPVPWYTMVFIAFPSVVLFTLLLLRGKNIPIKGTRELAKTKADLLVAAAIKPWQYPPCVRLCSAHANGAGIAALAARTFILNIEQLELMMLHEIVEMKPLEEAYSINVVETHLAILRDIQKIMTCSVSNGNLVAECYRQLRGGNAVISIIEEVDSKMEMDIIYHMETFLQGVPTNVNRYDEHSEYADDVKQLIITDIPQVLSEALEHLLKAKEPAKTIYEQMKKDWHDDVQEAQDDVLCRPVRKKPPKRKGMKIDSIHNLVEEWKKKVGKTIEQEKNKSA